MEHDPRTWVAALRSGHDRLAAYADRASAGDLAGPSMCSDWTVGQVLSHLGSGAEISLATMDGAMMVGFVGQFTPRDTRPDVDTTITVITSEPERCFELELGERAELRPAEGATTAGELALPAGALVRLTSGRLPADCQHGATMTGPLTLDDVRRAFPGY